MKYDEETVSRAKALITELVAAAFMPKAASLDDNAKAWEIVCKHVALAEGKTAN